MKSITQIKSEMAVEGAGQTPMSKILDNFETVVKNALWKDSECLSVKVIVPQERSKAFLDEISKADYTPNFMGSYNNVETGRVDVLYEVSWGSYDKLTPR